MFPEYTGDWKNMNKVEIHLMIAWADAVLRIEKIEKMEMYPK